MRKSKIAARIHNHEPIRLAMMGYFLPPFVAFAAHEGYDGIWLELEHRTLEPRDVQTILMLCQHYDIDCLVRPPTRERAQLYRLLEDGATGLIMPHVPDIATAQQLVQAVKFPPLGDRGIEGNTFETNFGLDISGDRHKLVEHDLAETLLCIQIETPQALAECEAIAALDGVDMLYVGPADMGLRLKYEAGDISIDDVFDEVAEICRRYDKPWGSMPGSLDIVKMLHSRGAQIHVWGIDHRLLRSGLVQMRADLDDILS